MKTILKYTALVLIAITTGCSDDNHDGFLEDYFPSNEHIYYYVSPRHFTFGTYGDTEDFEITAENLTYTIGTAPQWLTIERGSSNYNSSSYDVTADPNYDSETRTGIFDINFQTLDKQHGFKLPMTAEQEGRGKFLNFTGVGSSSYYTYPENIPSGGGTIKIDLNSNCPNVTTTSSTTGITSNYHFTKPEGASAKQTIDITIPPVTTNSSRTITIYLEAEGVNNIRLTVNQSAPDAGLESSSSINFPARGGSQKFNVNSTEDGWTITQPSANWCSVVAGTKEVTIQCTANTNTSSRSTSFSFNIRGIKVSTVTVTQAAPSLQVSPTSLTFENTSGQKTVTVTSDVDWDKVTAPSWVTVSPTSGKAGNTTVTIKVKENESVTERTGTVSFTRNGWTKSASVSLRQAAYVPEISEHNLIFERTAGSQTITINAKGSWRVIQDSTWPEWLTVSKVDGSGTGPLTFTVTANNSADERTAKVFIYFGENKYENIIIKQRGLYLDIESRNFEFNVYGGTSTLSYTTNSAVTFSIAPVDGGATNWLSIDTTKDSEAKVTVPYNNSANDRSAYIVITPTETQLSAIRVPVTQKGRDVECTTTSVSQFFSAGTSQAYTVTADGTCDIAWATQPTWATINVKTIASPNPTRGIRGTWEFTVKVDENSTETSRTANLVIKLTGLPNGQQKQLTIPVYQYGKGIVIDKVNWGEDHDWNGPGTNPTFNITINNNWGEDHNWN